ncbi:MAG: helix-turn-helix domain-containing protein [Erysipelotrichaceae bacterium]|nr:helix-turn-helix domain-containing protein [Erysipelotrichaceae bacterium]MDD3924699.1 helix-turn-helix domain-containing protein [Erysipelotrichaceae bacterium]MDD4642156.1 helix-turn-helix domain-containing protein [Erysipelotrichaceae bacterium]
MKDVGEKLRLAREGLGVSLDEMSYRTRIAVDRLQAIENGDIAFFSNDISYLRYYIRFYCNTLNIDFEDIRTELDHHIDEFHETKRLKKLESIEQMDKSIKRKAELHDIKTKLNKKFDLPILSLFVVVIILAITLISVFIIYIFPNWFKEEPEFVHPDPIVEPVDEEKNDEEDEVMVEETDIKITNLDDRTFQLTGYADNETVAIKIIFGRDTWVKISYDGVVSDNPASKIYKDGSFIEILYAAKNDGEVLINLGGMNGNQIYVNDELVDLNDSIAQWNTGLKLTFIFKGE